MPLHNRFLELDALRGLASLMVVFFHLTMGRDGYNSIFKFGTTGVDLFFMISGFVIYLSLEKVKNASQFLIFRSIRIYPTFWASLTFTFLFLRIFAYYFNQSFPRETVLTYFANLTMFQQFIGKPDLDGPYWTLIIEMTFYLFMAILLKTKLLKHIKIIGTILCIASYIIPQYYGTELWAINLIFYFPVLAFFPLFFAGILFYKIYHKQKQIILNYCLVILCLLIQLSLFDDLGRSRAFINYNEYAGMLISFFVLFTLFVNRMLSFIVNKVTLYIGSISYALYLVHQSVSLTYIIPYCTINLQMDFWITVFLINIPIVILVASAITYYIEIPVGKLLRRKVIDHRQSVVRNPKFSTN